jgi:hypothetical protein
VAKKVAMVGELMIRLFGVLILTGPPVPRTLIEMILEDHLSTVDSEYRRRAENK